MDIISYRRMPPGEQNAAGNIGVSGSLHKLSTAPNVSWYGWVGNNLMANNGSSGQVETVRAFGEDEVQKFYRFANAVIWALLHSFPEFVDWVTEEWTAFVRVQQMAAQAIIESGRTDPVNVNDYQLLLLPEMLNKGGIASSFFLHGPFPASVSIRHVRLMRKLVHGMLGARVVGFHNEQYAGNFLRFVQKYLGRQFVVDFHNRTVTRVGTGQKTIVRASPIGTDAATWEQMAQAEPSLPPELEGRIINLKIGRMDPAKGIPGIIRAWEIFQRDNPRLAHNRVLYLIAEPSREMISCFREERRIIEAEAARVAAQYPGTLILQKDALPPRQLATLYRKTSVLLQAVGHGREGWGLTGVEFVSCQNPDDGGVIGMSPGAGVFSLLGNYVTELDPEQPAQMADALVRLNESIGTPEAVSRMRSMRSLVPRMDDWWQAMQLPAIA